MNRAEIIRIVRKRMAGSPRAAQHTHIECHCPGNHRTDEYEEGCFCPPCARKEAVKRGLDRRDVEPEADGPDDTPLWCESCGRLITAEISPDGAEEELVHWESDLSSARLDSPMKWREFMLCVRAIQSEHLPRIAAIVNAASAD